MGKEKKPMKFTNVLESLDQFKVEHNFQFTKKEAKGSLIGFCCSAIYIILLVVYGYNRVNLFSTHDEDSYDVFSQVNEMKDGPVEYQETQFIKGLVLQTTAKEYEKVLLDEDQISEFIHIYSAQLDVAPDQNSLTGTLTNNKTLRMGCKNQFNTTRFTRVSTYPTQFCIDEENDYKLHGNFETEGTSKTIAVNIDRCKTSPT